MHVEDQAQNIPISQIIEPFSVLRLVNKDSIEYLEMRDSIAEHGLWNSISVRPAESKPGLFEIIDGLYRFTICCELQWTQLPCIVKHGVTDDQVLAAQIGANAIRPETKPAEFANQMKRLLTRRPEMTIAELAHSIHKSPTWVSKMLGLLRLSSELQKAVDRGEIVLQSAYMLAKMPQVLQTQYADQAKVMPAREFKPLAASIVKQFLEAVKQGCMDSFYKNEFKPTGHLRSLPEIEAEYRKQQVGGPLVVTDGCRTPLDGFYAALRWVLHLDRESVEKLQRKAKRQQKKSFTAQAREDGDV